MSVWVGCCSLILCLLKFIGLEVYGFMAFLKLIDCLDIVFRKFSTSNLRFGCLERLVFQTTDNIAKHIILNFLNFYANGIKTKLSKHCLQLNYLSKIL